MLLKVAGARSAEQPGIEITKEKGRNFDAGLLCKRSFDLLARQKHE